MDGGTLKRQKDYEAERDSILDGTADAVSALSSKIIRVFLSSTFSDMSEERNLLLKEVYPKIQEYAKKKYGVLFQMVDMRWGVTNEAQNDHMTSTCCLKEIENCQRVSVGPNFVMLIGQKYGYRPIPASIEADEFEALHKLLEEQKSDLSTLDVWYLKDENSAPAQYVLQPINSILKDYDSSDEDLKKVSRADWQTTFEKLRELLMEGSQLAFDQGIIGGQTKEKYYSSVTQEEIEVGLLHNPGDVNKKSLCFFRDIENLHDNIGHHRAVKFIDLLPGEKNAPPKIDRDAQDMLRNLRDVVIPQNLNKDNIVKLSTRWSENGGLNGSDNSDYLGQLEKSFFEKMIWLIDQNLAEKNLKEDVHDREVRQSLQIRDDWSKIFFGRSDILKTVEKYLKDAKNRSPFFMYGESGCGKTALIAKCAKQTKAWVDAVIMVRFLGTSPQSSHILMTLISLCTQICDVYKFDKTDIPSDYKDIIVFFHNLLKRIESADRRLIIYLDSIDQLSSSFDPSNFLWLPRVLPDKVKIIMTLVPSVNNLLRTAKSHTDRKEAHNFEPIPMLGDSLCMEIIKVRLEEENRTLTQKQSEVVARVFSQCSLPLYSRIMLEEIMTWKSYSVITSNMVSSSIREALDHFFQRLEAQHGRTLVRHALAYITAAREGVSELELLDLLSLDDEVLNSIFLFWLPPVRRLPPFLWTRLRIDLNVFLVTRDGGDVEVLTWYHRLFKEAAMDRYLRDDKMRERIHANIAEYFLGVWNGCRKPFRYSAFLQGRLSLISNEGAEDRTVAAQPLVYAQNKGGVLYNKRKLIELPFNLIKSNDFDRLATVCLFDYTWIWTKIKVFGLQFLLEDYDMVQKVEPDKEIQALSDALRISGTTLNDNPDNLSIELPGRLLDFYAKMPKVAKIIRQCDQQGLSHSAIVVPYQLYEVPTSALTMSLESTSGDVGDIGFLKNSTQLVSISTSGTVCKWDLSKGTIIQEAELPKLQSLASVNMGLYITKNERYLVCTGTPSPYIYTLDADTLKVLHRHKSTSTNLNHSVLVHNRFMCVDNAVFEITTGKKIHDLNSYRKLTSFVVIEFSVCEQFIFFGGDKCVEMFSVEKKKRIKQFPVPHAVSVIKAAPDGRLVLVGMIIDCTIRMFDVHESSNTFGQELVVYDPNASFPDELFSSDSYASNEVSEISISNSGRAFVSLVKRKYPIVWSLRNVSVKPRLLKLPTSMGSLRFLFDVQFTSDDKYLLAAELSPNIMMWDTITGGLVAQFQAHPNNTHNLSVSTNSHAAATLQQIGSDCKVWNLLKVLEMEEISSKKKSQKNLAVQNIAFSSQSNLVFMSRVMPPKSSKAYHFIDFFGVDVFDVTSGKTGTLIPFDKYGPLQTIAISKDGSMLVVAIGSSTVNVFDMREKKLVHSLTVPGLKSVKLARKGEYMSVFTSGKSASAILYSLPEVNRLGTYEGCSSGMFTKRNIFVGITRSEMIVRQSMDDDEVLRVGLSGDVLAIHYCDVKEILLVTQDDGFQIVVTAFKTEGFGSIGSLTGVKKGLCDIADDGSICIDSDLQVFEIDRCKMLKRLMPTVEKRELSSVRLSSRGQHAVFADTTPTFCVKVCRVNDSQIVATCNLHNIPEMIEIVPTLNIIIVIGKDKNISVLALRDGERMASSSPTKSGRLSALIGVEPTTDVSQFELPEKVLERMKEQALSQQVKHMQLDSRGVHSTSVANGKQLTNRQSTTSNTSTTSSSCVLF